MGGVPVGHAASGGHLLDSWWRGQVMRWPVMLLCLVASSSWASTIPIYPPPNVAATASGMVTTGAVTLADVVTATEMRAAVGARSVGIAATMTLGEGATAVALQVLRATPAIATASALAYLAQIGIQKCLDGTWCKPKTSPNAGDDGFNGFRWANGGGMGSGLTQPADSPAAQCAASVAADNAAYGHHQVYMGLNPINATTYGCSVKYDNGAIGQGALASQVNTCVSGYVYNNGKCSPDPNAGSVPTTDADWNKGLTYPVPPQVASDLSAKKVPIPVDVKPKVDPATGKPAPVQVSLGDPYVDPVTGKRYRDVAVITPNSDGKTATLTTARQEVDANGNPVTDPATGGGKPPEKQEDPCSGHETRMGCMEQGEVPEGPELQEQKINVSITPDAGWGPDMGSCPADIPLSFMGHAFGMSWSGICSFASMIRPIVLAMAWLGAALIVVGASKQGGD
jgi:hypothetical protein